MWALWLMHAHHKLTAPVLSVVLCSRRCDLALFTSPCFWVVFNRGVVIITVAKCVLSNESSLECVCFGICQCVLAQYVVFKHIQY